MSKCRDGRVYIRNSGLKGLKYDQPWYNELCFKELPVYCYFTAFSQSILCALESSGGDFYELPQHNYVFMEI